MRYPANKTQRLHAPRNFEFSTLNIEIEKCFLTRRYRDVETIGKMDSKSDRISDSDGEFPEIGEMMGRWKRGGKVGGKGKSEMSGSTLERKVVEGDGAVKSIGVGGKKKRVLMKRNDNPLLRPLGGGEVESAGKRKGSVEGKGLGGRRKRSVDIVKAKVMESFREVDEESVERQEESPGKEDEKVTPRRSEKFRGREPRRAVDSKRTKAAPRYESEDEEEDFREESDGLSDFIVDDSTILDEEDSVIEAPAPKSVRRLVRGRRPVENPEIHEDSDDLTQQMEKLTVNADPFKEAVPKDVSLEEQLENFVEGFSESDSLPRNIQPGKRKKDGTRIRKERTEKDIEKRPAPPSSDIEDPFILRYSPSQNMPRKVSKKETRFVTPPGSPSPKRKGLQSPKKLPRIPLTPHRPSMDSFWQQDIVNDWNDEYSPRKTLAAPPRFVSDNLPLSPTKKSPTKEDRLQKEAKKAFSLIKVSLAESFLAELDAEITDGQISKLSESTGGVSIIWSKKLNTTAGRANWKRETIKSSSLGPEGKPTIRYRHYASIELAEKVIDDEDRLLNVIAHEFCHLANFMITNMKTNPHGKEFKAWAAKCGRVFGARGVEVTTKHSYVIDYKYVWECVNCGLEFKRHSKSIDVKRHTCGSCKSQLVQTKPVPRGNGEGGNGGVGEYQMFVKENMGKVREENPGSPQKVIMGLVGKKYQEFKAAKSKGESIVSVEEIEGSREVSPVGDVVKKLDFLDLTSP